MRSGILFVDDEVAILRTLHLTFQSTHRVFVADSPAKALEIVKNQHVEVVVSDQRMPEMQGVDLLKQVKEIRPTAVRILLTGYSELDDAIKAVNLGDVYRYVTKPWDMSRLKQTIGAACEIAKRLESTGDPKKFEVQKQAENQLNHSRRIPHLLFIDENPLHLDAVRNLFKDDYIVYTASDMLSAFELVRKNPVAVIISDTYVGPTSGADLLAVIKSEFPDIVSILLSDNRDIKTLIRLINESQVFRYLIKPLDRQNLRNIVKQASDLHLLYQLMPDQNPKRVEHQLFNHYKTKLHSNNTSLDEAIREVGMELAARESY